MNHEKMDFTNSGSPSISNVACLKLSILSRVLTVSPFHPQVLTGSPLRDRIRVGVIHPPEDPTPQGRSPPEEALQGDAPRPAANATYAYLVIEVRRYGGELGMSMQLIPRIFNFICFLYYFLVVFTCIVDDVVYP